MTIASPRQDESLTHLGDVVRSVHADGGGRCIRQPHAAAADASRAGRRDEDGDVFAGMGWGAVISLPFWAILAALIWF